jgi:hypothetical protein
MFEKVTLNWEGRDYVIPADKVMEAVAIIEEIIGLPELSVALSTGRPPMARIAKAYAALLAYAGVNGITQEAVYAGMFDAGEMKTRIHAAVTGLMQIMIPPDALKALESDTVDNGPPPTPVHKKKSLKRYTRR